MKVSNNSLRFNLGVILTLSSLALSSIGFSATNQVVAPAEAMPACPLSELKETPLDCPYAGVARAAMEPQYKDGYAAILRFLPSVSDQIQRDSRARGLLALWGESSNYDENAKGTIVELKILAPLLKAITARAPRGKDLRIVNAGAEHTYGYLFSNLNTPYGYKRARWVDGKITTGFGLSPQAITPVPSEGTLLANVTRLFGEIAMRGEKESLKLLRDATSHASDEIKNFNFDSLTIGRATEATGHYEMRSDVVRFKEGAIIIYSVHDHSSSPMTTKLITGFPIERSFAKGVLDPATAGKDKVIVARYNAHIEGITGSKKPVLGTKTLSGASASEF